ncbi:hypothetical protein JXB28_03455 [Candidatus Woesearchaeota archaeon]|nr:hypothetical protein [Candidatus Woesearchaeota archaeon]
MKKRQSNKGSKLGLENAVSAAYKVVTKDMKSLGLRRNPNIIIYPEGEWYFLPREKVVPGKGDYGGIWVARSLSAAKMLNKYMKEKYSVSTRIFRAAIGDVLYQNSYRIKTDRIKLGEEIIL